MADDKKAKPTDSLIAPIIIGSNEFWRGFRENELPGYRVTDTQKQQFLQYPALRTAIRLLAYPVQAAKVDFSGDEHQIEFLREWFKRYYRRVTKIILKKAYSWGFCAGEKVHDVVEMDGKKRLVVKGLIAPTPHSVTLLTSTEPLGLRAFEYYGVEVPRDRMAYYTYQGDEISEPYGISVVDDVAWAMDMLFKDWTMWQVYKKYKAISFLKIFYPETTQKQASGTTDPNKAEALTLLNNIKEAAGITIGQRQGRDGNYIHGWDVEEIQFAEKTSAFIDGINKEESLVFVGAIVPRKIIEQEMTIGSYSLLEGQADFFVEYVLGSNLDDYEEALRAWVINPMLQDNFGSVKAGFNLKLSDEMVKLFVDIIKEGIRTAQAIPDYDEIMDSVGVPHKKDQPETKTETHQRGHTHQIQLQGPRTIRKAAQERLMAWIRKMQPKIERIKMAFYGDLKKALQIERGKIGLRVGRIYGQPKVDVTALRKAVQVPRSVYSGSTTYLTQAWTEGAKAVFDDAKEPAELKTNTIGLRKIQVGWEGVPAPNEIAGEGEMLEKRLFTALMGITNRAEALNILDTELKQYIEKLLPNRVHDLINNATQLGVLDAINELNMRKFKNLAEGGSE